MEIIVRGSRGKRISQENKTEHRWERRAKMLKNRGYSTENIHAMMDSGTGNFPPKVLEKMIKHDVKREEMDSRLASNQILPFGKALHHQ